MADLQLAPAPERSALPAILIAVAILAAVAAGVFYFNPHKTADLAVTGTQTFAPHTEMTAMRGTQAHGMRVLGETGAGGEDNLYIVTNLRLTDKLRLPLFVSGATAHVAFADGSQADVRAIAASDLKRLQAIFPPLVPLTAQPIADGDEVAPGQTKAGSLVLLFPDRTADAWKTKKPGSTITVELRNQEPQTAALP